MLCVHKLCLYVFTINHGPVKRIESLFKTFIHNAKFNQYDFQIYISIYAQNIFPEICSSEISRLNITIYDSLADVTSY